MGYHLWKVRGKVGCSGTGVSIDPQQICGRAGSAGVAVDLRDLSGHEIPVFTRPTCLVLDGLIV